VPFEAHIRQLRFTPPQNRRIITVKAIERDTPVLHKNADFCIKQRFTISRQTDQSDNGGASDAPQILHKIARFLHKTTIPSVRNLDSSFHLGKHTRKTTVKVLYGPSIHAMSLNQSGGAESCPFKPGGHWVMMDFASWLSLTDASQGIQATLWVIPAVQCIHILAISVVMGSVLMTNLRILGLAGRSQTMTSTARRFVPWFWSGFLIAAASGSVMVVGEPIRELMNVAFWSKMALLAIALMLAVAFQTTLNRRVAMWETTHDRRQATRILAVASLIMWCAIMILGRWIAYVQVPMG